MKHEYRTGWTRAQHLGRSLKSFRMTAKEYRALLEVAFSHVASRNLDEVTLKVRRINNARAKLREFYRIAFGAGPNRKASVLLVPELRKRRSERDPVVLADQIKRAHIRLADIKAGRVAAN